MISNASFESVKKLFGLKIGNDLKKEHMADMVHSGETKQIFIWTP